MSAFTPLTGEISLQLNGVFARVSPWGASLTNLVVDGHTAIEHVSVEAAKYSFAAATLAPWPNRLRDGEYSHLGETFKAGQLDDKANANHGLVFNREFVIDGQTESSAIFSIDLGDDPGYPFKTRLKVVYELTESGVNASIEATNLDTRVAPMAFGSHPYISVDGASEIQINAKTQMVNDDRQIPVGREPATKNSQADGSRLEFASLKIDDCFADLDRDQNGIATTSVFLANGATIELWQDESFKYLMVFAHHFLGGQGMLGEGLALEPQTAPANTFQSGEDLLLLEPGQSKLAQWGISFNQNQESK